MEIPKIEKRIEARASTDKSQTDVYIYGFIGSWYGISAEEVKDLLAQIKTDIINVHINSGGGDAFESVAIYNLLRQHKAKINIYVDGLAASGASEIAMVGDKIFMPKNTMMMIHNAWTFATGNAKELRKIANDLEKIDLAMIESYAARFIGKREELVKLLDEETWLTADECEALGFCDEVIELTSNKDDEGEDSVNSNINEILSKYIPGFAVSTEKENKINCAKEQQKITNAKLLCSFLENLTVKENKK